MKSRYFLIFAWLASCAVLQVAAAATVDVYFDLDGDGVQDSGIVLTPGDAFTAAIYTNTDVPLQSWGVQLDFDAGIVQGDSFSLNSTTWIIPANFNNIDPLGKAELGGGTLDFLAPQGTLHLADIVFLAVSPGEFSLTLSELFPTEQNFIGFLDAQNNDLDPIVTFGSASVTVVPLPAAGWLMLGGLVGLIGIARRQKQH